MPAPKFWGTTSGAGPSARYQVQEWYPGFVFEPSSPAKGTEMLLYELGVDEDHRRRGVGRALVVALLDIADGLGCRGMWVPIEPDNDAAVATYRSAGADAPEPAAIMSWTFRRL